MWVYVLLGLGNFWMVLIKVILFLFLLGVEDVVYWVCELGGIKIECFIDYFYGDWCMWYFFVLLVFYLMLMWIFEKVFDWIMVCLSCG